MLQHRKSTTNPKFDLLNLFGVLFDECVRWISSDLIQRLFATCIKRKQFFAGVDTLCKLDGVHARIIRCMNHFKSNQIDPNKL